MAIWVQTQNKHAFAKYYFFFQNGKKDVCRTVIKNNSGCMQTWYKPKVEEPKQEPPKKAEQTAPRPTAIPSPKTLISNKTRGPVSGSSERNHTSINRKRRNTFFSKSKKITKITTLHSKAKDSLANAEKNFSSNSNKNFYAGSSTATVTPVRKMPIRKQNYSFINEMFEKNKSKTGCLTQNDLQLQTHSTPNFVVPKERKSSSKIPLFKDTRGDNSQVKRKSASQIKDLRAKKTESLKVIKKLPYETARCAVLSDLNHHTSNRSSAKRSGKPEEIIYCAICSLLEQIEYCDPDECLQVMPATEFDQAHVKFLADHKHLNDRYASKIENKMVISAGQLTDLIYLDNLKTKHDFKPTTSQQTQPKVACQKRFCLTRLYSPISSEQETIDDKIFKHNAKLEEPRSKVSRVGRRMDSDDDVHLYTPPSLVKKELKENYSSKSNLKSNKYTNRKPSPPKAVLKSPTRSLKSESSDPHLNDKDLECLMRELELLKIKGLLSDDDYDDDVRIAPTISQKQQGKVKHSIMSIKGHINKNLNAKRGTRDDLGFDNENKKKNFYKIVKRFVSECLSPSTSHKNVDEKASPNILKECKPFIFESSRYTGGEEMSKSPEVPLENRLHHLLSSSLSFSKESPPRCIEIPPCRSVKDFLQMPPKFFMNTDHPFKTSTDNNNLSHNNNEKFAVATESSPWGEYLNVVEHLERKKQRKKTSSEVLRIAWNSLNFGESFCRNCKHFPSNIFGNKSPVLHTVNGSCEFY